jgi:hypothetical protein
MFVKRLAVLGLLLCTFSTTGPVSAQQSGDTIVFALPDGTDVTTGPEGDKVIYVGRPMGVVDAESCSGDTELRPLQSVMLVDAGSGSRATRQQGLITISINGAAKVDTVKNGTRIGNLTTPTACNISGALYWKYSGTIE